MKKFFVSIACMFIAGNSMAQTMSVIGNNPTCVNATGTKVKCSLSSIDINGGDIIGIQQWLVVLNGDTIIRMVAPDNAVLDTVINAVTSAPGTYTYIADILFEAYADESLGDFYSAPVYVSVGVSYVDASSNVYSLPVDLRRAVAQFTIDGQNYSGFLVNNTNEDGRLLFLTTSEVVTCHSPNWSNVQFRWTRDETTKTSVGATVLATEGNITLLELSQAPNLQTLTYLGWDIGTTSSIHRYCVFDANTSPYKGITNTTTVPAATNLSYTCGGNLVYAHNYTESSGAASKKVVWDSYTYPPDEARGAPLIMDNAKVNAVYTIGNDAGCINGGPSYFYNIASTSTILNTYLRPGATTATNTATVKMNYCVINQNLSGAIQSNAVYSVSERIISSQAIVSGYYVEYDAGTYIQLTNGFISGNNFLAMIAPCENNVVVISAMVNDEDTLIEPKTIITAIDSNVQLKIYPTIVATSGGVLKVEATADIQDVAVTVSDMQGKLVHSETIGQLNIGEPVSILLPDLASGMYFAKAGNKTTLITQKIIVQ